MYRYVTNRISSRKVLAVVTWLIVAVVNTPLAMAGEAEDYRAIESASITLSQAIDIAGKTAEGQVLEAEFEVESGAPVFRVRIVRPDGKVQRLTIDLHSGEVLRTSSRGAVEKLEEKLESFFRRRPRTPEAPKLNLHDAVVSVEKAVIGKVVEADVEKDKTDVFWYEIKVMNDDKTQSIMVDPESGRFRLGRE